MIDNDSFASFEPLWKISDMLFKVNNKIGFNVKFFCLNKLIKNKDKHTEEQTNTLIGMVQEVQEIQKKMAPTDIHCKQKEYEAFITKYFSNLESQRTNEVITHELGHQYHLFSYLLEPLEQFNSLNDKARKIQTFCIDTSKDILKNYPSANQNDNQLNDQCCSQLFQPFLDQSCAVEPYCSRQMNFYNETNNNQTNDTNTINTKHNFSECLNDNASKEISMKNQAEDKMAFNHQISTKKYVNILTPLGKELSCKQQESNQVNPIDELKLPEKLPLNNNHSTCKVIQANQAPHEDLFPSQFGKQANFVKKNNLNAIAELQSGNIKIAIQLIKNSINTLNTLPKRK